MPKEPSKTIAIILTVLIGIGVLIFFRYIISYFFAERFEIGLLLMAILTAVLIFAPLGIYEEKKQEYELEKRDFEQNYHMVENEDV